MRVLRAPQAHPGLRCRKAARAMQVSSAGLQPSASETLRACGARRTFCPQADWELSMGTGGNIVSRCFFVPKTATVNFFRDLPNIVPPRSHDSSHMSGANESSARAAGPQSSRGRRPQQCRENHLRAPGTEERARRGAPAPSPAPRHIPMERPRVRGRKFRPGAFITFIGE